MPRDKLADLSLKLLGTSIAKDGEVVVSHVDYRKVTSALSEKLRCEVNRLLDDMRSAIPNDFSFLCTFEIRGVQVSVDFEDGNTAATAWRGRFTSRKSLFKKIRGVDWDGIRGKLIQNGGIFEDMVRAADDRPVNIPSSRDAAKRVLAELRPIINGLKEVPDGAPFSLVTWREDEGLSVTDRKTRDDLVGVIGDAMTTEYDIVGVVEGGKEWTFDAIESAKLEAVELLGPISRAKAERRFFP